MTRAASTRRLRAAFARWWWRRRAFIVPLSLLLAFAVPQLFGGYPQIDSGLYAGVSLLAFERGDWWTLMAGDVTYFRKPPLTFWIHGAFFQALGQDLWVMRLPNLLAAAGCVAVLVAIARRFIGWRSALISGIVFVTTIDFIRFIKRFVLDYWHLVFILIAIWIVVAAMQYRRGRMIAMAGIPLGLALMTKPLVALICVPLLFAWLLMRGDRMSACWTVVAGMIAVLIAVPWHVGMIVEHGDAFVQEYFGKQIVERSVGGEHVAEPWWWYGAHLARSYWPWLLALAPGCIALIRRARERRFSAFRSFSLVWCVGGIIVLSAFADKRDRYLLPVEPIFAMICALWLVRFAPMWLRGKGRWIDPAVVIALLVSIVVTVAGVRVNSPEESEWPALFEFIRANPNEHYQLGTVEFMDGGRIYYETGIWPRNAFDAHGNPIAIDSGTLLIDDVDVPPGDVREGRELFAQGRLRLVRVD